MALKGYVIGERPASRAQSVGELTIAPRKAMPRLPAPPQMRSRFTPSRTFKRAGPKDFVVNPQMANCRGEGPELIANAEMLQGQPLSKMPKARGERAVARLVDGCPVAVTIAQGPIER
jgi:hypothetical protein